MVMRNLESALSEQIKTTLSKNFDGEPTQKIDCSGDKGRINIRVPLETAEHYKDLAKKCGLSMTRLVLCGLELLEQEMQQDKIKVSSLGLTIKN